MGRKSSKYTIEGVGGNEGRGGFPIGKWILFVAVVFAAVFPFTNIGKKVLAKVGQLLGGEVRERVVVKEVEVERLVPVEVKIPVVSEVQGKETVLPRSHQVAATPVENVSVLSNSSDIHLKTEVKAVKSEALASEDRKDREAYKIEYKVHFKLPQAAAKMEQLEKSTPALGSMFPGLKDMVKDAQVSPYFFEIYKNKADRIKRDAPKLKSLLTRHNFYDLQTILNMKGKGGRRVMLMQADMDVVSDGSDGDRLPEMPDRIVNSTFYQPSTSYFWKKRTKTPNPMIAGFKARVKKAKLEIAQSSTSPARKAWLKERLKMLERKIEDMKYHSYLVAEYDPFIVIPISMLTDMGDNHAPKVGDYAVVIYKEKLYPCIVGDGGPTFKVGEASLRMAKALNSRAGIYSRPVSDLSVTYLVFPNSRESKKSPPDYTKWREKCESLINEIGGLSPDYALEEWENTFPEIKDATP